MGRARGASVNHHSLRSSHAGKLAEHPTVHSPTAVSATGSPANVKRHMRTVRLIEIADLLGVTKQRAHQIAEEKGFPAPLAEDARGRVWPVRVQAWAKRWRAEKLWR